MLNYNLKPGFIQGMQVIYMALLGGVGAFLAFVLALFFINNNSGFLGKVDNDLDIILMMIGYLFALLGSAIGVIVFEKNMRDAKRYSFVKEKAVIFRTAYLIRMALHELGAFVSIVMFMLGGNFYVLGATAVCLIALAGARPTADFVSYKLYLTPEEGAELAAI
jgi:hypothetical protein